MNSNIFGCINLCCVERVSAPVPCATSCPELSRLPSSDSETEDECCLLDRCPCLQPVVDTMEDTFDRQVCTSFQDILIMLFK